MAILKYKYKCKICGREHGSYFPDLPCCIYCESTDVNCENIIHLQIDKFSDEGKLLYYDEKFKEDIK